MRYIGIDPGSSGAIALYSPPVKGRGAAPAVPASLSVWDIPHDDVKVGRSVRKRIDVVGLDDLLADIFMLGDADRIVVEEVGAMPKQAGMFAFGFGVGVVHSVLRLRRIKFETVTPTVWKREVKLASKDKGLAIARAEEVFPDCRHLWRDNSKSAGGKLRPDRAEAALMAYYAATVR